MIKHVRECDCYECSTDPYIKGLYEKYNKADRIDPTGRLDSFDAKQYLGKFVRSDQPVNIYKAPGNEVWRVAKPNSYIGKAESFNAKMNWLKLTNGDWIYFQPELLKFTAPSKEEHEFSLLEKIQLAAQANVSVGSPASMLGAATVAGATDVAETVADFLPDWSTIKWVLIGVAVVIVLAVVYRIAKG